MNSGYPTNLTEYEWQILKKIWNPCQERGNIRSGTSWTAYSTSTRPAVDGDELKELVHKTLGCKLEVVLWPNESPIKFDVIPLRWIVEMSFTWQYNFSRITLDYEFYLESSEAMIQIAFSIIMLNKVSN